MNVSTALDTAIERTDVPQLKYCNHSQATRDFAWLLTRNALNELGFAANEASRLAGSVSGTARQRLDKLVQSKHIVVPDGKFW